MKKILTLLTTLVLITLLFLPLAPFATGEGGNDGEDERQDQPQRFQDNGKKQQKNPKDDRMLTYKVTNDSVTVFSRGEMNGQDNIFYFSLEQENGLYLHINYFRKPPSEEMENRHWEMSHKRMPPRNGQTPPPPMNMDTQDNLGLSLEFLRLREFNQSDSAVSSYEFSSAEFRKPVVKEELRDGTISSLLVKVATQDDLFRLRFYLFANHTSNTGAEHRPQEIKYDVIIDDYPFQGTNTQLALDNVVSMPELLPFPFLRDHLEHRFSKEELDAMRERTLGYEQSSASMLFSWAGNVTVDGAEHNVTTQYSGTVEGDSKTVETMSFIYPAGDRIYHDPTIGVFDLLEEAEEAAVDFVEMLLSWSTGLGVGLVLVAVVGFRHRPGKFDWEE